MRRLVEEIEWTDEDEAAADRAWAALAAEREAADEPTPAPGVRLHCPPGPTYDALDTDDTPPDPAIDPDWPSRQAQPTEADHAWLKAAGEEHARMLQRIPAILREMEDEDRRERQEREQRRQRWLRALVLDAVRRTRPDRRWP